MKKIIIILITLHISLFTLHETYSQGCLPEGIMFETQAEIDSFQINYPGCTEIEGDVTINGDNITNLNGLITLNSIAGNLIIGVDYGWNANPALEYLTGLENLTSIGGNLTINGNSILINLSGLDNLSTVGGSLSVSNNPLLIDISDLGSLSSIGGGLILGYGSWLGSPLGNPSLASLTGLEGFTTLAWLQVIGNHALTDLNGLNNLQSVTGSIRIGGNGGLTSLSGLDALISIGGDLEIGYAGYYGWVSNPSLSDLTGLEGLTEIGGDLQFGGSALVNLEGLNNLMSIGNDFIFFDNGLVNLEGIDNLDSVGGSLLFGPPPGTGGEEWVVGGNPALQGLTGMEDLDYIGGDLLICRNSSLASLSGIENVTAIGGDLVIAENDSLADCEIQSICNYLANPNGTVEIHNNAPGCNSQEEVEAACWEDVSAVDGRRSAVSVYPNPTHSTIEFRVSSIEFQWVSLKIYDVQGREVAVVLDGKWLGDQVVRWDATALPAGIYFYRLLTADRRPLTGKLVKY